MTMARSSSVRIPIIYIMFTARELWLVSTCSFEFLILSAALIGCFLGLANKIMTLHPASGREIVVVL